MRRLTVMLLVNDLRIGGAERQLVELARGLDKTRFRAIVVTLYPGQPFEKDLCDVPGVELRSLNRSGKYDAVALLRLVSLMRRERVDVVQPFLTPATAFGLTAALIARTPVKIVTERCGVRLNTHLGNNLYRFVEDRLTRFANAAIPNSEAGAVYLRSRGISDNKIRVIYNGVAPERVQLDASRRAALRKQLGVAEESPLIGIVASLTPAKDHVTLLNAAAIVLREVPDAKFLLVGDGPLRADLERRASTLGLSGSVIFAGHQTEVAGYIGAMDLAVLSSCDHEGCSNFLLEAMGLGRPMVATDVGGNKELAGDGVGALVPPSDPKKLAEALLRVLSDREEAGRMGARGREVFRKRFTLETMVGAYEDLYAQLWEDRDRKQVRGRRQEAVGEG